MGIVSALSGVLGWVWNVIILGVVLGLVLTPILAKFGGAQASYYYNILISPRKHWGNYIHGYRPCPKCGGVGHFMDSGGIQATPCWFCHRESQSGKAPYGYVSARYLRDGWDWREGQPRPGYPYNLFG